MLVFFVGIRKNLIILANFWPNQNKKNLINKNFTLNYGVTL